MDYVKTNILIEQAQGGDLIAREELYRRVIPRLERFARGRIPLSMRRFSDTQEVVQDAVLRSLNHLDRFTPRWEGAFLHYLSKIVMNRIRDLARRKRPETPVEDEGGFPGSELSPVEEAVGRETFGQYQEALATLKEDQRMAVFLHVEMGCGNDEIAEALDRGPEAARKVLARGLQNLARKMGSDR